MNFTIINKRLCSEFPFANGCGLATAIRPITILRIEVSLPRRQWIIVHHHPGPLFAR